MGEAKNSIKKKKKKKGPEKIFKMFELIFEQRRENKRGVLG